MSESCASRLIHALHNGRALCGKKGEPGEWLPHERWVSVAEWKDMSMSHLVESTPCSACSEILSTKQDLGKEMFMKTNRAAKGYVTVRGTMEVTWTVELPEALCRESVACEDPAVEAAMQAVQQEIGTLLWGSEKPEARVFCEVMEDDVVVEEDERE